MEFVAVLLLGLIAFGIGRSIYWKFDHSGWQVNAAPNSDAEIVDFKSERVTYGKNDTRIKTTVTFSDGFYYITHKSNSESHFMSYTLYIDDYMRENIICYAKEAHKKAIAKRTNK